MSFDPLILVAVLLSYVLGSVPTGLWLGLALRKIDIRQHGSKNIGATNTLRVLGKPLGGLALGGDVLKGVIAVTLCAQLADWPHLPLVCGLAAIFGHLFSIFLRFDGGKGVATSTGVFLGLVPIPTLIAFAIFALVFAITRMVSAGSLLSAIGLTVLVYLFPVSWPVRVVTTLVALLIIVKHRTNIQRIFQGSEHRF